MKGLRVSLVCVLCFLILDGNAGYFAVAVAVESPNTNTMFFLKGKKF